MVDAQTVAVVDGVEQLEEDRGDEAVVAEVAMLLGDHPKQVARGDIVEDDVDNRGCLDDPPEGDHVRVRRCAPVEGELAAEEGPLAGIEALVIEALDGCRRGRKERKVSLELEWREMIRVRGQD